MPVDLPTSPRCDPANPDTALPAWRNCHPEKPTDDPAWYWKHPGMPKPGTPSPLLGLSKRTTEGLGFGASLYRYQLDWGDRLGIMIRKKVLVSCLHGWNLAVDRTFAYAGATAFLLPSDVSTWPVVEYLLNLPAFAGLRWHAQLLYKWCEFASGKAGSFGRAGTLSTDAALAAAVGWVGEVEGLWKQYTIETFPYVPAHMVLYWSKATSAADLSDT